MVPIIMLSVWDEYNKNNFNDILAVGQYLFEQFAGNIAHTPEKT